MRRLPYLTLFTLPFLIVFFSGGVLGESNPDLNILKFLQPTPSALLLLDQDHLTLPLPAVESIPPADSNDNRPDALDSLTRPSPATTPLFQISAITTGIQIHQPALLSLRLAREIAPLPLTPTISLKLLKPAQQRYLQHGYLRYYPSLQESDILESKHLFERAFHPPAGTTHLSLYLYAGRLKPKQEIAIPIQIELHYRQQAETTTTSLHFKGSYYSRLSQIQLEELRTDLQYVPADATVHFSFNTSSSNNENDSSHYSITCNKGEIGVNSFNQVFTNRKYQLMDSANGATIGSAPFGGTINNIPASALSSLQISLNISPKAPPALTASLKCKLDQMVQSSAEIWSTAAIEVVDKRYATAQIAELTGQGGTEQVSFTVLLNNPTTQPSVLYYQIQTDDVAIQAISADYRNNYDPFYVNYPVRLNENSDSPECGGVPCIIIEPYQEWQPHFTIDAIGIESHKTFTLTLSSDRFFSQQESRSLALSAIPAKLTINDIEDARSKIGEDIEFLITLNRRPNANDSIVIKLDDASDNPDNFLQLESATIRSLSTLAQPINLQDPEGITLSLDKMANKYLLLTIPVKMPATVNSEEQRFTLLVHSNDDSHPAKTRQAEGVIEAFKEHLSLRVIPVTLTENMTVNSEQKSYHYQLNWQQNRLPLSASSPLVKVPFAVSSAQTVGTIINARTLRDSSKWRLWLTFTSTLTTPPHMAENQFINSASCPLTMASDGKLITEISSFFTYPGALELCQSSAIPFYYGEGTIIKNTATEKGEVKIIPVTRTPYPVSREEEKLEEKIGNNSTLLILQPVWE